MSIGYLIMRSYPSFEDARHRKEGATCPDALSNGAIPGAGGNVYAALDTLEHALKYGVDAGLAWGDDYWSTCASGANYGDRHAPGQRQADAIKDEFRKQFARWCSTAGT